MSDAAQPFLNLSAYRFVPISQPEELAGQLRPLAEGLGLKGTVLIAEEGINLFLAGREAPVRQWLQALRADPRFAGLAAKESWSATQPFRRLKVKVKGEIIRMNQPAVQPAAGRAPAVAPATLARWLAAGQDDQGRPVVMLDTRNAFEVDHGAFDGAIDWRLEKFSDFPAALATHAGQLAGKTVVSYCTGGIRCEKAALVLQAAGIAPTYQLEGGILKYFEETDGAPHWHGKCFVFDEREALASDLLPATPTLPAAAA